MRWPRRWPLLSGRGSFAKEIEMWFPAHTTALDSARADLESMLPAAQFSESPVQFIGSATADVVEAGTGFADYWYTNLRSTVRFDRAIETAARRGARIFVELSAHPALLFAMGDLLRRRGRTHRWSGAVMVGSGRRDEPITERLSRQHRLGGDGRHRLSLGRPPEPRRHIASRLPVRADADRTSPGRHRNRYLRSPV